MNLSRRQFGFVSAAVLASASGIAIFESPALAAVDLNDPRKKDIAMQIVSAAENSSLDWKAQYKYIEDIDDGRGYTAGIIGFCSGTGDMLDLVELYKSRKSGNVLAKYLPALRKVNGSDSHSGLDPNYTKDWVTAAKDSVFKKCQDDERDRVYFNPAVSQAKKDNLRALGQFIYYDAIVMHGDGGDRDSFGSIRRTCREEGEDAGAGWQRDHLSQRLPTPARAMSTRRRSPTPAVSTRPSASS
jgi:chitosanase